MGEEPVLMLMPRSVAKSVVSAKSLLPFAAAAATAAAAEPGVPGTLSILISRIVALFFIGVTGVTTVMPLSLPPLVRWLAEAAARRLAIFLK